MSKRHLILAGAIATMIMGTGPGVTDHGAGEAFAQTVSVTVGRSGDRWLDTMQYLRVARGERSKPGKRSKQYGYEVTYASPDGGTFTLFWSRDQIDFRGASPPYRLKRMKLGNGQLHYPDKLTRKSLPQVYEAVLIIERDYAAQADGAIVAAQAFATVAGLGAGAPAARAPARAAPKSTRVAPARASVPGAQAANTAPVLSQTTRAQFLASATQQVSRGGVTAVGRAIQKHAARPGSYFQAGRNAAENARHGADFIRSLLNNPACTVTTATHKSFGPIVKVRLPNGAGAQFKQSGDFIGLLEPFVR